MAVSRIVSNDSMTYLVKLFDNRKEFSTEKAIKHIGIHEIWGND
ncbi:hypothetical protein CCACVL1_29889 [Corchorus capsularis]|uniref:Uncharacterized protein n=1 Tax=Corchorus capsularis TaxID=210143 RepID=A0A1R3FZP3_COCAP|nr:hypothetical protein CCACVL1_29889 [Corchorus capsularis]